MTDNELLVLIEGHLGELETTILFVGSGAIIGLAFCGAVLLFRVFLIAKVERDV